MINQFPAFDRLAAPWASRFSLLANERNNIRHKEYAEYPDREKSKYPAKPKFYFIVEENRAGDEN